MLCDPPDRDRLIHEFASQLAGRLGDGSVATLDAAELPRSLPPAAVVLVRGAACAQQWSQVDFPAGTGALVVAERATDRGTPAELVRTLTEASLPPAFVGWTPVDSLGLRGAIAIAESPQTPSPESAPADFRVLAIMTMYNERDIAAAAIGHLRDQGIEVHVIDNWSTDGGADAIRVRFAGDPGVSLESFPSSGPTRTFELRALLRRVEEVAASSPAAWVIHHDSDEIRQSPWPHVTLRDALHCVGRRGFDCVDHTVIDFRPTVDGFAEGTDPTAYFRHFEFGRRPGHFQQIKAWRNKRIEVDLASSGGHLAVFPNQRVFPYKFLLRHYPVRSQAQGERKIVDDRQQRWDPEERALGWHTHYDGITAGTSLLHQPARLHVFDERFHEHFLIERLLGVGLIN